MSGCLQEGLNLGSSKHQRHKQSAANACSEGGKRHCPCPLRQEPARHNFTNGDCMNAGEPNAEQWKRQIDVPKLLDIGHAEQFRRQEYRTTKQGRSRTILIDDTPNKHTRPTCH